MTRKEIIEILVNEYQVETVTINKLKLVELEKMLEEYRNPKKEDKGDKKEFSAKDPETLKTEKINKSKGSVEEIKLKIHELKIKRFNPREIVTVKNLGGGDVFVSDVPNKLMDTVNLIRPQEIKEFTDVNVLYITTASRPTVQLTY